MTDEQKQKKRESDKRYRDNMSKNIRELSWMSHEVTRF